MGVFSSIEFYINSELQKFIAGFETLNPGDILEARIIEIKKNGRALIDLGKFRAVAYIHFPIRAGEHLALSVVEKEPQLKLQALTPGTHAVPAAGAVGNYVELTPENALNRVQTAVAPLLRPEREQQPLNPLPEPVKNALQILTRYFEPINPEAASITQIASQISRLVHFSGLFLEKELADVLSFRPLAQATETIRNLLKHDLRAGLSLLRDFLRRPENAVYIQPGGPWENLSLLADELLLNIRRQIKNSADRMRRLKDTHPETDLSREFTVFHFPLPLSGTPETARLKIYFPRRPAVRDDDSHNKSIPSHPGFRLAMLLDLDPPGDLRADLFLRGDDLSIIFYVADIAVKNWLDQAAYQLEENLKGHFRHLVVSSVISEKKINGFETEDLDSDIMNSRMIDVKV